MAEQIKDYRGVFEMFDEEGNGQVKTGELVWLMGLLGINPTKSELASMAKDVDRDSEAGRGSPGRGGGVLCHPHPGLAACSLQRKASSATTASWP